MTWTLCTSGAAIAKAGANVNTTIVASGAALANWSDEAESLACSYARSDVVSNFSGLTANGKQVLQEFCASHIAEKIISYQPESVGKSSATLRLNVLENNIIESKKLLIEDRNKTYLGIT